MNNRLNIALLLSVAFLMASCSGTYFNVLMSYSDAEKAKPSKVFRLDLSGEDLTVLPNEISGYKNLKYLDLSGNPRLDVASTIMLLADFDGLEVLKLDSMSLKRVPDSMHKLAALNSLSLAGNPDLDLESAFEELSKLSLLSELNLSFNRISHLPNNTVKLKGLENLRLSGNQIKDSENFRLLGGMDALEILWLDNNGIKVLPAEIELLKVRELYLDNNRLSGLPLEIKGCEELCILYLGENKLETFPMEIVEMPKLYFLILNRNRISKIPDALNRSGSTLKAIILDNNRLSEDQVKAAKKYFKKFFLLSVGEQGPVIEK